MRFGDSLKVIYDLETADFRIPTFTLQPIIENSIRHGLKNGKGTICIQTKEHSDHYEVSVTDDGSGFKTTDVIKNERQIGLENVKKRLDMISQAYLRISSTENKGTVITIILPKE